MMKQVIFIAGTAYSGSTFLQFILANDPAGFAIGESQWLFYPNKAAQIEAFAEAAVDERALWTQIRHNGVHRLYQTIFDAYPQVSFIVDASKHPVWISRHARWLAGAGIDVKHLLIWKTPLEFAASYRKRGRRRWVQDWLHYHRLYFSLIPDWRAVSYKATAVEPTIWQAVCAQLEIPYFEQKTAYWRKRHLAFGGNYSARFHLVDAERAQREYLNKTFDPTRMDLYRRIYYTPVADPKLEAEVARKLAARPRLRQVAEALRAADVESAAPEVRERGALHLSDAALRWERLKYRLRIGLSRWTYGRSLP